MANRYTLVGLLSVLALTGVVALAVAAFGGSSEPAQDPAATTAPPVAGIATPTATATATGTPATASKLVRAAQAAGCTLASPPNEGVEHVTQPLTVADYGSNPPTSGPHSPEWAPDGIYLPGETPMLGNLVHTLEHGRINIQYRPGTPQATVKRLEGLYDDLDDGYHLLLYENPTGMEFAIAATAWDQQLGCPEVNGRVYAALREFRNEYVDKGPETVP